MGSIVLKSLSVLLGIFFVFVGIMKVTSIISKDLHKDLRKDYVKYAKVFPLSDTLEFKLPSKWYRRVVGSLEIICGLALAFIPIHAVKQGANITLLIMMTLAVYSHWQVNDKFERIAPALVRTLVDEPIVTNTKTFTPRGYCPEVFFFMLTGRMVIDWQLRRKEALESAAVVANGEKKQN